MAEKKDLKEEKDGKEEIKPKKSFLKFIILGVIVLVLGAAGYTGWSLFLKGKKEEIKKEENKKEAQKAYLKKIWKNQG